MSVTYNISKLTRNYQLKDFLDKGVVLYSKDRKKKEKELNLQKIISHGFDPVTSFRPYR